MRPRQDSNLRTRLRRPALYPLSYEGLLGIRVILGRAAAGPNLGAMPETTVLVVDDDPVIQQLLRLNFEMEGYSVLTAGDGVEGLERARGERPDAVVLDIMMPRMDGLEVARALKRDPNTAAIPVLLLSAKAQQADLEAGWATGADDYVTKPFDPLDLLRRVGELVTRDA